MRLLHSKLFYLILILIIGISTVLLLFTGNNTDDENNISIDFFVSGTAKNNGCLSVYVHDLEENEYSFDNGQTWQKSKHGAVYQSGEHNILVRNQNAEIIYEKTITVNSIVDDAPVIKLNFDDSINNKEYNELLKGVSVTYNGHDVSTFTRIKVLEEKDNKLLLSYLIEKDGKKCYLMRETMNNNIPVEKELEWVWPTNKPYKISRGVSKSHNGIDIYGLGRGTPIYAALDGEVTEISSNSSSGYYVIIKHNNGYYTRYAHLQNTSGNDKLGKVNSATKYISVGQIVKANDQIGELGDSGNSTGLHLHFEVWDGKPFKGKVLNPLSFYK